jgi:hypothetical protein
MPAACVSRCLEIGKTSAVVHELVGRYEANEITVYDSVEIYSRINCYLLSGLCS